MMRIKSLLFLLAILSIPVLAQGQLQPPYDMQQSNLAAYELRMYEKLHDDQGKGAGEEYDLKYHRFEWYINPDTCYISGSVLSRFVPVVAPFSHVRFELSSLLTVDSVIFHGNPVSYSHSSDVLDIDLGVTLTLGVLDSIEVYYQGIPNAGIGFGSFIKDFHNGVPVIWTLSEPYGTKDWWPCKNILSDKIDSIDVIVTTPIANRVASNGVLISETIFGSDKTFHWKHRYPIAAYLVAIAVTNFSVYSDWVIVDGDSLEMLNYVFPEDLGAFQTGTAQQVAVLQLFDSLFGDYPYMNEKYGHAQFKWGGGMEHQTMSFVVNAGFDLLAHEMSHQWYGDKVTCGSWQDIWVNEGFATYSQGLTLDFMMNGYWFPFWLRDRINSITSLPDGSVFCYDTSSVSRVFDWRLSYQKGAMVLHMLRWIIGDTAFFQGMKNIIADPQLAYGYAKTDDIQQHFENVSGLNLTEYFLDWIYREGHPVYTINAWINPDSTVNIDLSQNPSHSSVSFFELPVPLYFKNSTQDTILVFNNTFSGQDFVAELGFVPDSVFFDPEMKLLALCDTIYLNFSVSINPKGDFQCSLEPNPVQDHLYLTFEEPYTGDIIISDLSGRTFIIQHLIDSKQFEFDTESLAAGNYLIRFNGSHNNTALKFVKL